MVKKLKKVKAEKPKMKSWADLLKVGEQLVKEMPELEQIFRRILDAALGNEPAPAAMVKCGPDGEDDAEVCLDHALECATHTVCCLVQAKHCCNNPEEEEVEDEETEDEEEEEDEE